MKKCVILNSDSSPCEREAEIGDMCYVHWNELENSTNEDDEGKGYRIVLKDTIED